MRTYGYIFLYSLYWSLFINQEEVSSLRAKIAALEEELCKARKDSSEYHNLCQKLENVLCECLLKLTNAYSHSPAKLNHDLCRR